MLYRELIETPEPVFDAHLDDLIYDISAAATHQHPDNRQVMQLVMQLLQYARSKGKNSHAFKTAGANLKKMQAAFGRTIPELRQLDLSLF